MGALVQDDRTNQCESRQIHSLGYPHVRGSNALTGPNNTRGCAATVVHHSPRILPMMLLLTGMARHVCWCPGALGFFLAMSEWRVQIKKTYGRPIHGHVLSPVREPYWTRYGNRNHRRGRKKIKKTERKEPRKETRKGREKGLCPPTLGFPKKVRIAPVNLSSDRRSRIVVLSTPIPSQRSDGPHYVHNSLVLARTLYKDVPCCPTPYCTNQAPPSVVYPRERGLSWHAR